MRLTDEDQRTKYEHLLREYLPALRRLVHCYAREATGQDDHDDLLQEIAVGLWTALPGFRGDSSERTWVYRIAHNTAISFVTGRRRRSRREQSRTVPELPAPSMSPESNVIKDQQRVRLWAAVEELPLADRQIVVLHFEGLSAAEIEAVTGLSAGNVATRLTRVRQKLVTKVRGRETG